MENGEKGKKLLQIFKTPKSQRIFYFSLSHFLTFRSEAETPTPLSTLVGAHFPLSPFSFVTLNEVPNLPDRLNFCDKFGKASKLQISLRSRVKTSKVTFSSPRSVYWEAMWSLLTSKEWGELSME